MVSVDVRELNPSFTAGGVTVYCGDVLEILSHMKDESVDCVVTSPPYFGLRDYQTAVWSGGDESCDHLAPATGSTQNKGNNGRRGTPFLACCGLCGAERTDSQLGLEATPAEYIAAMVNVFRDVRRVMTKTATLWLNMGDSYAGSWGAQSR